MSKEREVVFDNAIRAADMLHQMFGSICEVAVHDFKDLDRSLIHVAGSLTGRSIGSPATDLVLREYRKKLDEIEDISNYFTVAKNGVRMKSSTVFLRLKGKVIGAFCLNINISTLADVSKEITEIISVDTSSKAKESFFATVQDVVKEMFEQVVTEIGKPIESFGMEEKIGVVRALEERGVFLIKGALEYLSAYLKISKFTTYSYLQKIRAENEYTKK